jgi:pimeloyl-ACP methyl ester carboxylesterase
MATEKSPVAGVTLDEAAGLFASQAHALGGGRPVVAVAHSMRGVVLTRAAQDSPGLFSHIVYLAAVMPRRACRPRLPSARPSKPTAVRVPSGWRTRR